MKSEAKNPRLYTLLRDSRVLFGISVLLAMVVWLVLAVINGEEREIPIPNVPVRAVFMGTVAEELGLEPFWSGPKTDPDNLTVTVMVSCRRYENIGADALDAVLVTESVSTAGLKELTIRVTPKKESDRERFTIVDVTPNSTSLYFDKPRSLVFELTPVLLGKLDVAEGYDAQDVLLSKKSVSISGPAALVDAITTVRAEIELEGTYSGTAVFENISIVPVDSGGNTSPYLTVEGGKPQVNATLPVWKRATLYPAVDFNKNVPVAYLSAPLPVTVTPAAVRAALPEDRLTEDLRYSVGGIDFRQLSPGNNRFSFPAEELKEIRLFDETKAFTATVDLTGFDTQRFTLPGAQVEAPPQERFTASFDDLDNVVVVGPAQVVAALTPFDLTGETEIPEDARPGRATLPLTIRVNREDCWVYGEYTARATLVEE